MVATVRQHGAGDSGGLAKQDLPNEKRRKAKQSERSNREGTEPQARLVNLPKRRRCYK